jgi:hypothetical protein
MTKAPRNTTLRSGSKKVALLQNGHSEADLHGALLRNLGRFITELGRDLCFVGSEDVAAHRSGPCAHDRLVAARDRPVTEVFALTRARRAANVTQEN